MATNCAIFEKFATLLQQAVVHHTSIKWIDHYLYDYFLLAKSIVLLLQQMQEFEQVMHRVGMPIATKKVRSRTCNSIPGNGAGFFETADYNPEKEAL